LAIRGRFFLEFFFSGYVVEDDDGVDEFDDAEVHERR
jgi:hypothetical protein